MKVVKEGEGICPISIRSYKNLEQGIDAGIAGFEELIKATIEEIKKVTKQNPKFAQDLEKKVLFYKGKLVMLQGIKKDMQNW